MLATMCSPRWSVEKIVLPRETIVGVLVSEQRASDHVYLSDLAIDPAVHGKGYGRTALAQFLKRHGKSRVDLLTHEDNRTALQLYGKFGFRREGLIPNAFGNGQPFLLLVRNAVS